MQSADLEAAAEESSGTVADDSDAKAAATEAALNPNDTNNPIGQIRIEKETLNQATISISISSENRGKGYAADMLKKASKYFHSKNPEFTINAFIKNNNLNSINSFEKALFKFQKKINYKGHDSLNYILENENR